MNKRQKKKLIRKVLGQNPPKQPSYSGLDYHAIIGKPWGGLAKLKKQLTVRAVEDFNQNISNRNSRIRASRRYIR